MKLEPALPADISKAVQEIIVQSQLYWGRFVCFVSGGRGGWQNHDIPICIGTYVHFNSREFIYDIKGT